jgi:pimeloyl-ACP methyl ester carboxylesterase
MPASPAGDAPVLQRPPRHLALVEPSRAIWGASCAYAFFPLHRPRVVGDGQPVLVLPGFLAGDANTALLRRYLLDRGLRAHGWRLGRNMGVTDEALDGLEDRLQELADRYGEPISLVGWSLGGAFARWLALRRPEAVRQVVALGTPYRCGPEAASVGGIFSLVARRYPPSTRMDEVLEMVRQRLPVPSTAVYTRTDCVGDWRGCLEDEADYCESIRVRGSHSGLPLNITAMNIVTDRVAQPRGEWRPWRATTPLTALRAG